MMEFVHCVPSDPTARSMALIKAYVAAPDDADITLRLGASEDGAGAFAIGVEKSLHAFLGSEAVPLERVVTMASKEMENLGVPVDFSNLILIIREGGERALSPTEDE